MLLNNQTKLNQTKLDQTKPQTIELQMNDTIELFIKT